MMYTKVKIARKKFCKSLREHAIKINQESYENAKVYYICKEE